MSQFPIITMRLKLHFHPQPSHQIPTFVSFVFLCFQLPPQAAKHHPLQIPRRVLELLLPLGLALPSQTARGGFFPRLGGFFPP